MARPANFPTAWDSSFLEAVLYNTFGAGAPTSLVSPIVRLGGLLIASVAAILLLHEPLTARYIIGMVLAFGGVALMITS